MNDFREFSKAYNDYLMHSGDYTDQYLQKICDDMGRYTAYEGIKASMLKKYFNDQDISRIVQAYKKNDFPTVSGYFEYVLQYDKELQKQQIRNHIRQPYVKHIKHGINDFRDVHEDYLMHFGILGMKWGVRRYQNPDGTLTAAGKKRYDKYMKKAEAEDKVVEVFKDEKPK